MRLGLPAGFKEQESTCGPVLELSASVPPILSDAENRLAHFAVPTQENLLSTRKFLSYIIATVGN